MVESISGLPIFEDEPAAARSHGGCGSCGTGKALAGLPRCGNGLEKIYPTTAVRFGYMRFIGEFTHAPEMKFTCGAKVVIQTQRGIEVGEQASLTCGGCDKSVTRDQMRSWVESCGEDSYMFEAGRILREATSADLAEFARIQATCRVKRDFARQAALRHNLPIKVIECECPLGGERIIFYFSAAERVDFRDMVKDLAREYRTRIEMRQIGARDEARLLADYETCGREVCCKVFLKTLRPISMRMAKLQKATLDPSQVLGRCGRLKCCLRYEHVGYEELERRLPRIGLQIRTQHGEGVVVNRQILTQLVQIRRGDDTLITVVVEDIMGEGGDQPTDDQPDRKDIALESPGRPEQSAADSGREGRAKGPSERPAPISRGRGPARDRGRPGSSPPEPTAENQKRGEFAEPVRRRRRRRRRRPEGEG